MTDPTPLLLVVDDSKTSRTLIRAMVAKARPAWRIIEADNGEDALALIESEPPDFVSMDVNMPGINGLEAAGRIRLHHPQVRIVMCSANIQESTRKAAQQAGMHFVSKPITPNSVAEAIAYFEG